MSEVLLGAACPNCNTDFKLKVESEELYPEVRSLIKPIGNILVYKITSEEMKVFVSQKAKFFKEDVKVELTPRYCERKKSDPHSGYASLRIAFSSDAIERKGKGDWYEKIGEDTNRIRVVDEIYTELIKRYQYDRKELDRILGNYENLEKVENQFGMTEAFIEDIKLYSIPRRLPTINNESWIMVAARADLVIADMLEEIETDKLRGHVEIHDVYSVSKDVVEFIVYLHPIEVKSEDNPYIRKIMTGDIKIKR